MLVVEKLAATLVTMTGQLHAEEHFSHRKLPDLPLISC